MSEERTGGGRPAYDASMQEEPEDDRESTRERSLRERFGREREDDDSSALRTEAPRELKPPEPPAWGDRESHGERRDLRESPRYSYNESGYSRGPPPPPPSSSSIGGTRGPPPPGYSRKRSRSPPPAGYYDRYDSRYRDAPRGPSSEWGRSAPPPPPDYERDRDRGRSPPRKKSRHEWERGRGPPRSEGWRSGRGGDTRDRSWLYEGPLKSYNQFLATEKHHSRSGSSHGDNPRKRYEAYKAEYVNRQYRQFFEQHKAEEWFREKYDPEILEKKFQERCERAREAARKFAEDLAADPASCGVSTVDSAPADITMSGATLFIKAIPPAATRSELEAVLSNVAGNAAEESPAAAEPPVAMETAPQGKLLKLILSEPQKHRNFQRIGWAVYTTEEAAQHMLRKCNGHKFKDWELQLAPNKPGTGAEGEAAAPASTRRQPMDPPSEASQRSRVAKDTLQAEDLCRLLDSEKGISQNPLLQGGEPAPPATASADGDGEAEPEAEPAALQRLDRLVNYLRRVHWYCYYCAAEFDSEEDMWRKCGPIHTRGSRTKPPDQTATPPDAEAGRPEQPQSGPAYPAAVTSSWFRQLDSRVALRLESKNPADVFTGRRLFEQKKDEFFAANIVRLEEAKYRCAVPDCGKLFKGEEFVRKHIQFKHPEKLDALHRAALDEQFFTNYMSDPKRIQPPIETQQLYSSSSGKRDRSPLRSFEGGDRPDRHRRDDRRGGRKRGQRGRQLYGPPAMPPPMPPLPAAPLPPPPLDPRGERQLQRYMDLDAPPSDELNKFDYRMQISYTDA